MKTLKIDFQNFIYRDIVIEFAFMLDQVFLSMTSAKI